MENTNEVKNIESNLKETKESLSRNIGEVEKAFEDAVSEAKNAVKGKVRVLRENINLKHQTEKHPLELVGGAFLPRGISKRRLNVASPPAPSKFSQEFTVLKGMLIGAAINKLGDVLSEAMPKWKAEIREVAAGAASKVGT
jgi:hypothetical protein